MSRTFSRLASLLYNSSEQFCVKYADRGAKLPRFGSHTAWQRTPSRGYASFQQSGPIKTPSFPKLTKGQIVFITSSAIALIGFDVYHYFYLYEVPPIFDPEKYVKFELIEKEKVTDDTVRMKFKHLPRPDLTAKKGQTSNVAQEWPVCSHISVKNQEMQIQRPYTPTDVGQEHFELLVKRYQGGFMTPWLVSRKVGEKVEMKGPLLSFVYRPNMAKEIGMIAGGTGITPMYQIARKVLSDPFDKTQISLVYGSHSEKDILLRKEIDALAKAHPDRFKVYYMLDDAPQGWAGGKGYVDRRVLEGKMPQAKEGSLVFVCGPDPMLDTVSGPLARDGSQGPVAGVLASMGYSEQQVWKFGTN